MANQSTFPTTLDGAPTDKVAGQVIPSDDWNQYLDAVDQLETKVGVDNSAVTSTIDYQLKNLLSATNVRATTITATTLSATTLSGGNFYGTTLTGTTLTATNLSGTTLSATTVCGATVRAGAIGVGGSPNAACIVDVISTTQAFRPPCMTTAERDLIGSPVAGMIIFNTTTSAANIYQGSAWGAIGAGAAFNEFMLIGA